MEAASFAQAVRHWQAGEREAAQRLASRLVEQHPEHVDGWRLVAEIARTTGRAADAMTALEHVARLAPEDAANLRRLAELLTLQGDSAAAERRLRQALALEPDNVRALNNLGSLLLAGGDPTAAVAPLERAVELQSGHADAHKHLGIALSRTGRLDDAIVHLQRATALGADSAGVHAYLGAALLARGRVTESLSAYACADQRATPTPDELVSRAEDLRRSGRALEALAVLDRAVPGWRAAPQRGTLLRGLPAYRAWVLDELGRHAQAAEAAREALSLEPGDARALVARGLVELAGGAAPAAVVTLDHAIALAPELAKAHAARALADVALGRVDDALVCFKRASALDPGDVSVLLEIGHLMAHLGRRANALAAYTAVLERVADDVLARVGRSSALGQLGRHAEAAQLMEQLLTDERAIRFQDGAALHYLAGAAFHSRLHCCDWQGYDAHRAALAQAIGRHEKADMPFGLLAYGESPADQLQCAQIYRAAKDVARAPVPRRPRSPERPIRIGYLSPDLGDHPVGRLVAPLFEAHDRSRFEVHAFSAGFDLGTAQRRRLEQSVDRFSDVSGLQDRACAVLMAESGIDIAVDLAGHTANNRILVLSHRPAPVQLSFLGYPATTGLASIDYLVADPHVIAPDTEAHYSENIIYLPDTYFPASVPPLTVPIPSRHDAGLPERGFVYCSFNAPYKLSPAMFAAWMRILSAVPGSVLWLRGLSSTASANLASAAEDSEIGRAHV